LSNVHKLPVVTMANCLNGFFTGPEASLAETFLQIKDKGAVAVWASTGLGYPSGHRVLLNEFYQTMFQQDEHVLGAVTTAAKIAVYSQNNSWDELVQTFVLFGDPALFLGFPADYPFVKSTLAANGAVGVPIDQAIQINYNRPMDTTSVTLLDEDMLAYPFTPTWSATYTLVTYAHPEFAHGQTLTFTTSGQDQQGASLGPGPVPTTWSFTVTDDDVPPDGVVGLEGGRLAEVALDASIIITFTEPMRTHTVAYSSEPPVSGGLSWDASDTIARFYHASFAQDSPYTFTVTAARDIAGNQLVGPLELAFKTQRVYSVYLPLGLKSH
jgi:hypothetical protein